jgi:amino acid permease
MSYEERREGRRRFVRRNLFWLAPIGAVAGTGLFIGLGFLVTWLWRVTLGDIFGLKPISFWQAWGLMLLSQILFKANMQPTARTGRMHGRRFEHVTDPAAGLAGPQSGT